MGSIFSNATYQNPQQLFQNENYLEAQFCETEILNRSGLEIGKDIEIKNYKIDDNIVIHGYNTLENNQNQEKNTSHPKKKILLLHGYMSGGICYYRMISKLQKQFDVYAIDLPGMGLSSRPKFETNDFNENLNFFLDSIKEYTKQAELDKFILVGHSFGGYISTRFALQNPEQIEKLYLISPLGVTHRDQEEIKKIEEQSYSNNNLRTNIMKYLRNSFEKGGTMQNMSGQFFIPTSYILGKWMKYWFPMEDQSYDRLIFQQYLANILKLPTSSDIALNNMFYFTKLTAKEPLENLLTSFPIETHFYYGDRDWMCHQGAKRVIMQNARKYFSIVNDAGHNITLDQPDFLVNEIINFEKRR